LPYRGVLNQERKWRSKNATVPDKRIHIGEGEENAMPSEGKKTTESAVQAETAAEAGNRPRRKKGSSTTSFFPQHGVPFQTENKGGPKGSKEGKSRGTGATPKNTV